MADSSAVGLPVPSDCVYHYLSVLPKISSLYHPEEEARESSGHHRKLYDQPLVISANRSSTQIEDSIENDKADRFQKS
jgi:hypothetical protein